MPSAPSAVAADAQLAISTTTAHASSSSRAVPERPAASSRRVSGLSDDARLSSHRLASSPAHAPK